MLIQKPGPLAVFPALLVLFASVAAIHPLRGQPPQSNWSVFRHDSAASFRGLRVVDDKTAWVSGSQGTVLRSIDGGDTWVSRAPDEAAGLDFRDVHAFNADHAVLLTAGTPARVYHTRDGGENWQIAYDDPRPEVFFDAMAFWDERNGLAFSDPVDGKLVIIRTADGGKSWTEVDREKQPATLSGEAGFAASGTCLCISDGAVFIGLGGSRAAGEPAGARILKSTDRGESWSAVETPMKSAAASGVFSIVFVNRRQGVAVGGTYNEPADNSGNICITDDGGQTWYRPASAPRGYRSCVARQPVGNGSRLIAVSRTGTDVSEDVGKTWQPLDDESFHAADFSANGKLGIAIGPDGRIGVWQNPSENSAENRSR